MRTILLAFAVASAAAQTTHSVGPGGFIGINEALAVAAPGDVIVVQPGTYAGFNATIGVTIRAANNGGVYLDSSDAHLPAGQTLHLVDLDLPIVTVTGGSCTLDRCRVSSSQGGGPSLWVTNARVHLQDCALGAPHSPLAVDSLPALLAQNSAVTAIASSFRGFDYGGVLGQAAGGEGILLFSSTFHGSNLLIEGGDGFALTSLVPGNAIEALTSQVWISDSTLRGGRAIDLPGQPPWACPVAQASPRFARCTLLPAGCANGTTGPVLGVQRLAPMTSGAQLQLDFRTEPNELVWVWVSPTLGATSIAGFEQQVFLDLGLALPLALLAADAGGLASGSWTLPPGLANQAAWLQAVSSGPLPLQLSPVVGGVVR